MVLHDSIHNELRLLAFSTNRQRTEREIVVREDGNDIAAVVWREQKPLVLSPLEHVVQNEDVVRQALQEGINALTLVPLSNGARRLGILAFGFSEPYCPSEAELTFLQRVASEVSIAVDGYLIRRDLAKERDRMRVLSEITNSVISKAAAGGSVSGRF